MQSNFKTFLYLIEYVEKAGAIFIPESWIGDIAALLPKLDLGLPTVRRTGKIEVLLDKQNPIYVQLSDGSKMFFTYDEFRRIKGKPQRGKNMVVVLQRRSDDSSKSPSQIVSCEVL